MAGPTPLIASTRSFSAARVVSGVGSDVVRWVNADVVADCMRSGELAARSLGRPARRFPRLL